MALALQVLDRHVDLWSPHDDKTIKSSSYDDGLAPSFRKYTPFIIQKEHLLRHSDQATYTLWPLLGNETIKKIFQNREPFSFTTPSRATNKWASLPYFDNADIAVLYQQSPPVKDQAPFLQVR